MTKQKAMHGNKIIYVICIFVFLVAGCSNPEIPEDLRVLSMNDLTPKAFEVAKNWRADAYLSNVSFRVYPKASEKPLWATYSFQSSKEPVWLSVHFKETSNGIDIKIREGDYQEALEMFGKVPEKKELNLEDILLDSTDAVTMLYENGGMDFFHKHPGVHMPAHLYLEFSHHNPQVHPQWCLALSTFDTVKYLRMDAITFEMLPSPFGDE